MIFICHLCTNRRFRHIGIFVQSTLEVKFQGNLKVVENLKVNNTKILKVVQTLAHWSVQQG